VEPIKRLINHDLPVTGSTLRDDAGVSDRDQCNLPRHYALLTLNDASGEDTMGKLMSVALAAIPLVAVLGAMVVAP
jgi:hypothetical protein